MDSFLKLCEREHVLGASVITFDGKILDSSFTKEQDSLHFKLFHEWINMMRNIQGDEVARVIRMQCDASEIIVTLCISILF